MVEVGGLDDNLESRGAVRLEVDEDKSGAVLAPRADGSGSEGPLVVGSLKANVGHGEPAVISDSFFSSAGTRLSTSPSPPASDFSLAPA